MSVNEKMGMDMKHIPIKVYARKKEFVCVCELEYEKESVRIDTKKFYAIRLKQSTT